jgi:hypothetical protein
MTNVLPAMPNVDTPLGRFVAQLQSLLAVEPAHPFDVHRPAFTAKQDIDPPIAVAHAALGDLLDAFAEGRLALNAIVDDTA